MNLILFRPEETQAPLSRSDPRSVHVLSVLRRNVGDTFDVGLINGHRGKATVQALTDEGLHLEFHWTEAPPPLPDLHLLIGLPRPQTARKILFEAASLGVASLTFFTSERGEASYGSSSLWSSGEWRRHVASGVEQAFCTRQPDVRYNLPLLGALAQVSTTGCRIALDNYEASSSLGAVPLATPLTLAFGSERGWSPSERIILRNQGFILAHLGRRVLRTETAVVASHAIVASRLGLYS